MLAIVYLDRLLEIRRGKRKKRQKEKKDFYLADGRRMW